MIQLYIAGIILITVFFFILGIVESHFRSKSIVEEFQQNLKDAGLKEN